MAVQGALKEPLTAGGAEKLAPCTRLKKPQGWRPADHPPVLEF